MAASKSVFESPEVQESIYKPYLVTIAGSKSLPNFEQWKDLDNELNVTISQIQGGYKDFAGALDELARKWDGLLP